jgi:hypothetical protein
VRFAKYGRSARFIGRDENEISIAAVTGSVFQVLRRDRRAGRSYTSRITGMIRGRRAVCFTM